MLLPPKKREDWEFVFPSFLYSSLLSQFCFTRKQGVSVEWECHKNLFSGMCRHYLVQAKTQHKVHGKDANPV